MPNDIGLPAPAMPMRRGPSMIKNLIPTLPERGKVKIGAKGAMRKSSRGTEFQPPQKLDHFTVTTLQRGDDGNFLRDEAFHSKFGDRPTEIPVRLLYDDPALNFPSRYACFVGRTLWCSGDGETATRLTATTAALTEGKATPFAVPCPCDRQEPTYKGNDRCKMNGNLSVLIDGMGGVGGVWRFRTTSYNSIVGIMSSMAFIRSITGGVLANIPLKLRLQAKQTSNPQNPTQPVTIYVVGLEFAGDIAELQGIGHTIALERAKTHVSIAHIEDEARRLLALAPPANAVLPGDDADEIVEEFYPEQAVNPDAPPPRPKRSDFDQRAAQVAETFAIAIIDADGEEVEQETAAATETALLAVFDEAARRGRAALTAAGENNTGAIAALPADAGDRLRDHWVELMRSLKAAEDAAAAADRAQLLGAADEPGPEPAATTAEAEPHERDEEWWAGDSLAINAIGKEFLIQIRQRCREARTVVEVECLRAHNDGIDALGKADREQVLGWLADREAELKKAPQ